VDVSRSRLYVTCRTAIEPEHFTTRRQGGGKKCTSSGPQLDIDSAPKKHLIDPHPLWYQPRPRCAVTTRLPLAACQRRCAGEAQRRRYARHTTLACISRHRIGFLGFCFCLLIVAHALAAARQVTTSRHGEKHHDGSDSQFPHCGAVVIQCHSARQATLPRSHKPPEGRRWVLATAAKRTFPRLPPWQQFAPSRQCARAGIGHDLPV
jgi:hypothetical protein